MKLKSICCFLMFLLLNIFTPEATGNLGNKTVKLRPNAYRQFIDVSSVNSFTANLKGEAAGIIGLFDDTRIVYQIEISADYYVIRGCLNSAICMPTTGATNTTFNNDAFSPFWFRWETGQVEFGTGIVAGVNRIGLHQDNRTVNVKYWAVSCRPGLHYVNYEYTTNFVCHKGYKLVKSTNVLDPQTAISLVDCIRVCGKMLYCFAVNYRRQQYDNCEYYKVLNEGIVENDDVIVPLNITFNAEWRYCQMTER